MGKSVSFYSLLNDSVSNASSDSWTLDSGSNNHLTADMSNLAVSSPYSGPEQIVAGNGQDLKITHTGSSVIRLPHHEFLGQGLKITHIGSSVIDYLIMNFCFLKYCMFLLFIATYFSP